MVFDELWRDFRLVEALAAIALRQLRDGEIARAEETLVSLDGALQRELAGEEHLLAEAEQISDAEPAITDTECIEELRRRGAQLRALSERIRLHLEHGDHESCAEGLRLLRLALQVHQSAAPMAAEASPQP